MHALRRLGHAFGGDWTALTVVLVGVATVLLLRL
jgi:hypothetical protein